MLRLRALGGLVLEDPRSPVAAAITQPKSLALLTLLAHAGERPMSRDKLLAYLWPDTELPKAAHRLAQTIYALRHQLGLESFCRAPNDLRLNRQVIGSDLQDFTDAMERGDLARAVTLYQGPFLDGFYLGGAAEFERWVETERGQYTRKYRSALEALALAEGHRGNASGAAEWWRRLLETDPLNAKTAAAYLEALGVAAGYAGALRFARDYARRLRDEFDSDPDPSFAAATERLRKAATAGPMGTAIAVLPFVNLTLDRESEYFSDGMAIELASSLTRVRGLRVVSRTSAFALKGKDLDAQQLGERLGAGILVEGSIRKIGNRIRLHAQLVDTADGCDIWSGSYERTVEHVFTLQEELSQAIVAALAAGRAGAAPSLVRRPTTDVEAYMLYLRGRYSANKRNVEGLSLAIEYFEQAVETDPAFALAHAGLAECWAFRGFPEFGDVLPLGAMPKAKAAALEALRLNPELPEGHIWLGMIHFLFDWEWEAAERELRRALQLQPEHAFAENWYALLLAALGRHEEAWQRVLRAHALEPLSLSIRLCIGRCHFFARRHSEALACFEEILRDEPEHLLTTVWMARALSALGRFPEALETLQRVRPGAHSPYLESCIAYALAGLGRDDEARNLCDRLTREDAGRPCIHYIIGATYARLNDYEAAVNALMECRRTRDGMLVFVLTQPSFEQLRGHPRFERLLTELALPAVTGER